MFLLGALFVALVVGLDVRSSGRTVSAILIGLGGIGVAWSTSGAHSDKVAMRAMRAREVTPEEAPELHGMIDRLCALADMPKPRVGVADTRPAQRVRDRSLAGPLGGLRDHRHPGPARPPRSSRACSRTSSPTSPTATSW